MPVLGPGTLKIGAVGTEVDASCLVNSCRITTDKSEGDATVKLCGDQVPGSVTYTSTMEGNVDIDPQDGAAGLFDLSWVEAGTQQSFTFVPNTALGTSAAGTLVIDPLDFGADAFGDTLTSDFAFTLVGDITFTYATGVTRVLRTGVPIQRPRIDRGAAPAPAPAPEPEPASA